MYNMGNRKKEIENYVVKMGKKRKKEKKG